MLAGNEAGRMPALHREWNLNANVGRPFVVAGGRGGQECPPYMGMRLERDCRATIRGRRGDFVVSFEESARAIRDNRPYRSSGLHISNLVGSVILNESC